MQSFLGGLSSSFLLWLTGCPKPSKESTDSNETGTQTTDSTDTSDSDSNTTTCTPIDYYLDSDNDGYGDANVKKSECSQPAGYVTDKTDCDDSNGKVNPAQSETCNNGLDDNCDQSASPCLWSGNYDLNNLPPGQATSIYGPNNFSYLGTSASGGVDIDGDGASDLVGGMPGDVSGGYSVGGVELVSGKKGFVTDTVSGISDGAEFGQSVLVGELNGQEVVLVGEPLGVSKTGVAGEVRGGNVYLFTYSKGALVLTNTFIGDQNAENYFGYSTAIQGGQFLVVGDAYSTTGNVRLYTPPFSATNYTTSATGTIYSSTGDLLGWSLATGDFDGDGSDDLAVGAIQWADATVPCVPDPKNPLTGVVCQGAVFLFSQGVNAGTYTEADSTAQYTGDNAGDICGHSVNMGDVNGDGYDDLVMGCNGLGGVALFLGKNLPKDTVFSKADATYRGDPSAGFAVATCNVDGVDVDQGQYKDILVGAPDSVRAVLIYGSLNPASSLSADATFKGTAGDNTGWSVGCGGDMNGDTAFEFAIGSRLDSTKKFEGGRVVTAYGSGL